MSFRKIVSGCIFTFVFTAASLVHIRVRADVYSLPSEETIVDEPAGCFESHAFPCGLKTRKGVKFRARFGQHDIVLGSDSACVINAGKAQLLKGQFLIFTAGEFFLEIPAGKITLGEGSRVMLDYSGERTLIRSIAGDVDVLPIVESDVFRVLPGQENWLGRVREDHHVAAGLPLTTDLRTLLSDWARLNPLPKAEFLEQAEEYRRLWSEQRTQTAELLKQALQDNVAAHERAERARITAAANQKSEQKELRKMLWENTFGIAQVEPTGSAPRKNRRPASPSEAGRGE